jgi:aromatic ring-opening dioxygenase catalytic subunit (LigB family)
MNEAFEQWLTYTCTNPDLNENVRAQRLIYWDRAPSARFCHPREEHLLPLYVCYGMAESPANQMFSLKIMGMQASCYLW